MNIQKAVKLAAWLIATGRQPPEKAHFIAARKYGVDMHDVARLVGRRGSRAAARQARHRVADVRTLPPLPSEMPQPQLVTFEVTAVKGGMSSRFDLFLRAVDGPFAGRPLEVLAPRALWGDLDVGDRVVLELAASIRANGGLRVSSFEYVGRASESTDGTPARDGDAT